MLTCIAFYSYQCKAYLSIRVPTENGRVLTTNNFNRLILRDSWFAPGAKSAGFLPTGRKPKFSAEAVSFRLFSSESEERRNVFCENDLGDLGRQ
jgi:hypothetical protein